MMTHLVGLRVSLILVLKLRIVKSIRFKHHDMVLAFVILIVCVVRDPALRHNLAWSFGRIHVVGQEVGLNILVPTLILVISLAWESLGGLAFREATCNSTWAEIAPIWQVLETHRSRDSVYSTGIVAATGIDD